MGVRIGDFEALCRVDPLIEKEPLNDASPVQNRLFYAVEACFAYLAPKIVRLLQKVLYRNQRIVVDPWFEAKGGSLL